MALTVKELENAKPKAKKYKMLDGGGLSLLVLPTGTKLWLWRYQFNAGEKNMTFGEYPVVGPKEARELHFAAKKLLATGINPMAERRAEAEAKHEEAKAVQRETENSFEKVARKWWAWWSIGKSRRHAETLMNRLEADVFPVIGHLPIDAVQTTHIRDIMLTVETRGASDVAKRAHQSIGQIFRFAIARELASRNPAADFRPRDVLAATESENFAHVDEKDLPELLVKVDGYNGDALPEHLPREIETHRPETSCCPGCGGTLREFGEDVSEVLEYVPESFKVIRHVRPKFSCRHCETVVEAAAPSRPIPRSYAGPGLLAHVLVAKYCDHTPLNRQSEIYARDGVDLDRSTLAGWVGASAALLAPLVEAIRTHVLSASRLHADDTPVPVLAPGNGRTKTGRLWTYVRDGRPCADRVPPAVWFAFSPDRRGEHPLEEAQGFHALLNLEEPKYTIEQIGAKVGKNPAYVASRARMTELTPAVVEAFYAEEIGVGHALLLAKLQPAQQEAALASCFREDWGGGAGKAKRIVLPVRHLQYWIEHNVLLLLKQAPFDKRNAQLLPAAGSCVDCPKRTGHNKLLFSDVSGNADACTDPVCYAAKLEAHVQKQIAAKPEIVQISTAYGKTQDGSKIITRSKYVEIRADKPDTPERAKQPEFKTCRFIAEAIVSEGIDKGEVRRVCAEADCPIHHPKKQSIKADASFKAEQDKSRREQALANATGMRVLQTIVTAVPVRLMKKDFLFIAEQLLPLLDDKRLEMVARNRGIRAKEGESAAKLLAAFVRKAEEGVIGKLIVEAIILLSASKQSDGGKVLRAAAQAYKVDTDAISLKVKHEFAAKEKARSATKIEPKPVPKALKKTA